MLEQLWAAVLAEPESDAALSVWADALAQAGDPRGEFVQLQLAERTPDIVCRIDQLLARHRDAWTIRSATIGPRGRRAGDRRAGPAKKTLRAELV